jgi:hypothetical protein
MKSILAAFALLSTVSAASAARLDCTFPKSSPLEGVHGGNIYFRDGTAPAHIMVTHTDSEGRLEIRTAEVPTSGGVPTVFIGYVSPDGILGVVAVNQVSVLQAGGQGRCTGLDVERAKPITPGHTPSGTIDLMRLAGVDCVTDGLLARMQATVDNLCLERNKRVGEHRMKYPGTNKVIKGPQMRLR